MNEFDLKSKFKLSGNVLQSLFENGNSPLSEHFLRWKLWSKWRDLMGSSIADCCEPVGYAHKRLYIFVKNSSWLHHLYFVKGNMLRKIKKDFHPHFVQEIVFTLDRKKVPSEASDQQSLKENISQLLARDDSENS